MTFMEAVVTLGMEVRRLREQAHLSQEKLAERLGISREALGQIERGETKRPSDETLMGLEYALGLSRQRAHELMGAVPLGDQISEALLLQIAALPNREARIEAWKQLPDPLRQALLKLMSDLFLEVSQQLQGLSQ